LATTRDVARIAGVSVATISRVINKKGSVNPETTGQVLRVIEQLQYELNAVAHGLAGKKIRIIALILLNILSPFFPILVLGVEDMAHRCLTVILGNSDNLGFKIFLYKGTLEKVCGWLHLRFEYDS